MNKREKTSIIKKIKGKEKFYHSEIPDEYVDDKDIINTERLCGLRTIKGIGFDVINQVFFAREAVLNYDEVLKKESWEMLVNTFDNFDSYYDFLNGEIYDNACYYQCPFPKTNYKIDKTRFYEKDSLIDYNIDNYRLEPSAEDELRYHIAEINKKKVKKWIEKFIACDSLDALLKTVDSYNKSTLQTERGIDITFFFWQYIFYDLTDANRFKIIMEYMSTGKYPEYRMINEICHVYNPDDVLAAFNCSWGCKQTNDKHKRKLKNYVDYIKNKEVSYLSGTSAYFDAKTHYYCEKDSFGVCRFFETFKEFIQYRNYDLSDTNLADDIRLEFDFSKCKLNRNTQLPINKLKNVEYRIKKEFSDNKFKVFQQWINDNKIIVKTYRHEFYYFFDFVAFLKGDLSTADLVLCDGLKFLSDISNLDFTDAKLTSSICEKFGIKYTKYQIDQKVLESFDKTEECEGNTSIVLQSFQGMAIAEETFRLNFYSYDRTREHIYYLSDLHLLHKLERFYNRNGTLSEADVIYVIQNIVNNIVDDAREILLIGGDVSSDFYIFEYFVKLLRQELDRRRRSLFIVFLIGNHELWQFSNNTFEEIVVYCKIKM